MSESRSEDNEDDPEEIKLLKVWYLIHGIVRASYSLLAI
jgi:hypothetical protein